MAMHNQQSASKTRLHSPQDDSSHLIGICMRPAPATSSLEACLQGLSLVPDKCRESVLLCCDLSDCSLWCQVADASIDCLHVPRDNTANGSHTRVCMYRC